MNSSNTTLVYHRGGGKSLGYPPNCLLTIKWSSRYGAKAIEYDVVVTKDGSQYKMIVIEPKLLLEHNLDINNLEWNSVKNIDAGNEQFGYVPIATLQEVLAEIDQNSIRQQVHIKGTHPQTVPSLVSEITNLKNITVTSFDLNVLNRVKDYAPKLSVGWIVKPDSESGNEGAEDLTKMVSSNPDAIPAYTQEELNDILVKSKKGDIDVIILCGPKIRDTTSVKAFQDAGFEVGAWGVGSNLKMARRFISLGLDRFTIDNPEQLM